MAIKSAAASILLFIAAAMAVTCTAAANSSSEAKLLIRRRGDFPSSFIFGSATAAYQVEGAAKEGGRGPSIWDTFTHQYPDRIAGRSNGDVAIDEYHRYKEDVKIIKDIGMDAYRFSISWSRILPSGSLEGGINREGVQYYNNLINEVVSNGLKPFVTLFHWDVPQGLEDKYGGFLSDDIVSDFRDFAQICFKEFGDRVKHWITLNEPNVFAKEGYATGLHAPGRCTSFLNSACTAGDSSREPYLVVHHLLLAHATAVKLYRDQYQESQNGIVGITINLVWIIPYDATKSDDDSVERAIDFLFGWIMDPISQGDYPFNMRALVRDRLPHFNKEQSQLLKASYDFIGLNYYTTYYSATLPLLTYVNASYTTDSFSNTTASRNGIPIGPQAASEWLFIYPKGFTDALLYIKQKYNNPLVYITENGVDEKNDASLSLNEALEDDKRIEFYQTHLLHVLDAIRKGANIRGFFAWSIFDNFEWADAFTVRFGIYYIDYKDGLRRIPKKSAHWFHEFLKK